MLLEASGIKKSSYYKWLELQKTKSTKNKEDDMVLENIHLLYKKHKGGYIGERMTNALKMIMEYK